MTYPSPPEQPSYPPAPVFGAQAQPTRLRGRLPRLLGWIFLGVGVAAIVAGAIVLGTKSFGKVNGFQRVPVATGGTVQLNGTGKWVIYLEDPNVDSLDRIPFTVGVRGPSGSPVPAVYYGNPGVGDKVKRFTYDYNGHHGVAAYQFTANTPGRYAIQVGQVEPQFSGAHLAIGRDITTSTVAGALLVVFGVVLAIVAVVLLIVGYVKRSNHKGELRAAAYYSGAASPGYGAPPPGYGGTPPPGYGGTPPPGYGGTPPPGYGAAPPPGNGAPPPPGWGIPPQS